MTGVQTCALPILRPYIDTMRENIAKALKIDIDQVNVKATTEEGLGFTGEGLGISSQAICMLTTPREAYSADVSSSLPCGGCRGCGNQ